MKKIIVLSLLVISVVCGKSVEEIQSEWLQKAGDKTQKQKEIFWQSEEANRLYPHCQGGNGDKGACKRIIDLHDKSCKNGLAWSCIILANDYLQGNEQMGIKVNTKKAVAYANKVCKLDATFCASMSGLFMYKNRKLALKYAEKACKMGEMADCVIATEWWAVGFGGIGRNPQKVKYYSDKLCKAGLKEACNTQ